MRVMKIFNWWISRVFIQPLEGTLEFEINSLLMLLLQKESKIKIEKIENNFKFCR